MWNRETIEKDIRNAIYAKRRIDHRELPKGSRDSLGKHIVIPNDLRSNEDIQEESEKNLVMVGADELIDRVFKRWLPYLENDEREIVYWRCKGLPWGLVSRKLASLGILSREYSKRQLRRIFCHALDRIGRKFC